MVDAEPDPILMVGSGYLGGKTGNCHPNIPPRNQVKKQDGRQEMEGLKKEGADMGKKSPSCLEGKNRVKMNDFGLKKGGKSKVS
jgi:hypothetical protein